MGFDSGDVAAIKAFYAKQLGDDDPVFPLEVAQDTCGFSVERCRVEAPPLCEVNAGGHVSACWEADNLDRARTASRT